MRVPGSHSAHLGPITALPRPRSRRYGLIGSTHPERGVDVSPRGDAPAPAVGDPGLIEVFDTTPLRRHQSVPTEAGAHTLAFDPARQLVVAFLPRTHRAAFYVDRA